MGIVAVGVDNGLSGAAFVKHEGGYEYLRFSRTKGKSANQAMVKYEPIADWFARLAFLFRDHEFRIILEKPAEGLRGKTTATTIASTATTLGRIMVAIEQAGLEEYVVVCPAQTWQKHWWPASGKFKPTDAKPSVPIAQRIFKHDFIPAGCHIPQDGITDAALMAELAYGDKWEELRKDVNDNEVKRKSRIGKKIRDRNAAKATLPDPLPPLD